MGCVKFTYKVPRLYKDKENKKWCIRYAVKCEGEGGFLQVKEYGKAYGGNAGKSLNSIVDLKKRDHEFQMLRSAIEIQLKQGIFKKEPSTAKAFVEKQVKEANKNTFDYCLNFYLRQKGYINPKPKKENSAQTYNVVLKNQLRQFLERNNLLNDIREIKKTHLLEFVNFYYLHTDPTIKWSNNTYNNKRSYLGSFFSLLKDEDIIEVNPVLNIRAKPKDRTIRFGCFTKDELDILFDYLEKNDYILNVMSKIIYYSFIRISEVSRLSVGDFNLVSRIIKVEYDAAKGQKDTLPRDVLMFFPLQATLLEYLNKFEHQPDWYLFGKRQRPSQIRLEKKWSDDFTNVVKILRSEHPKLFNRENLTLYTMKSTGVTHLIEDNKGKYSTMELLQFVQQQCRHEDIKQTLKYWRQLGFELDNADAFKHL